MELLLTIILWCVLFSFSPVIAVAVLVLWPLVWVVLLPFRLFGICTDAVFQLLRALLFLPARLLGMRPRASQAATHK